MSEVPAGTDAPRVAIRTLGCKVNRAESDALAEAISGHGVLVTGPAADVVVVNTCTVTGEADAKARKEVRRALRESRGPVVVTGCLAAMDPDALRTLGPRVVVAARREAVAALVREALQGASPGGRALRPSVPAAPTRARVAVKVQDGCDHRCAYCIVPDARGGPRSVPAAEVVERVTSLVAAGTAEIVLTGVNIGRYAGGPRTPDLAALVDRIVGTGVARIRISSIEPLDLTPRLLDSLSAGAAVMPHLHVPLQSGCDRTLQAMRRGYDTAAFTEAISGARESLRGLAVTTDVIVGFPGETDDDFASSAAFVEEAGFARLHVFRYSARPGTPAAAMPGRAGPEVAARRASEMRALGERLAASAAARRVGGTAEVLVERVRGRVAEGVSEDYLRVSVGGVRPGTVRAGDVVSVGLVASDRARVEARL